MGLGDNWVSQARVQSAVLGTVGEPFNPKRGSGTTVLSGERCPIVDTWWQTETGGIMITPLPGATTLNPVQRPPIFWCRPALLVMMVRRLRARVGNLVITDPGQDRCEPCTGPRAIQRDLFFSTPRLLHDW
ncbi:MAG: hypothetical protein CM1200mP41_32870 [Gammaproteobacteria bacterium]|nr:MAG: hypothetical protein CM1200mP41_32870 [Gammaproteobacteria bacterium]